MALPSANRTAVQYIKEIVAGETPVAGVGQQLRYTDESFAYNKETVNSNELRKDTRTSDIIHVGSTSGGSINIELSMDSYNELFSACLCATASTPIDATDTIDVVSATGVYSSTATSFQHAVEGQWLFFGGFTEDGNNGWKRVITKTDDSNIIVSTADLVDAIGTGVETVKGSMLRDSTVLPSYTFETVRDDITQYFQYKGQHLNGFSLSLPNKSIVSGSFNVVGRGVSDSVTSTFASVTSANSNQVANTTHNVGAILLGGVELSTALQSITLDYSRNLEAQPAIGEEFPIGYRLGTQTGSGSLVAYFSDLTLYNDFKNHTYTGISYVVTDNAGRAIRITHDKIVFKTDTASATGKDTDILEAIEYESMASDLYNCQIQIDFI